MNTKYPLLNLMLQDMALQDQLYRPTTFWECGLKVIIDELEQNDVKDFRSLTVTRNYFVPGYSAVEYLENPLKYDGVISEFDTLVSDKRFTTRLQRVFTGYNGAFSDYRVLCASNIDKIPYTDRVSESNIGNQS